MTSFTIHRRWVIIYDNRIIDFMIVKVYNRVIIYDTPTVYHIFESW